MPTELEAKLKVDSHEPVRAALRSAGGTRIGRVLETNYLFDRADGSLVQARKALRVRAFRALDGPDQPAELTFKGAAQPSRFKAREEIEVNVSDAAQTVAILEAIGFVVSLVYEKRRERWRLDDCTVDLDELPKLGCFVEIEGPTEDAIARVRARLGLDDSPHVPQSYVAQLARWCTSDGPTDRRVRFPA